MLSRMTRPKQDSATQTMLILWIAMLVSQVMLFAVGQFVPPSPDAAQAPGDIELIAMVFTGLGVVAALASALAVPMLARGQPYITALILRCALAETPTIFGLVLAMMGAPMQWVYVLTGLGLVAHLSAFPSRAEREAHAKT